MPSCQLRQSSTWWWWQFNAINSRKNFIFQALQACHRTKLKFFVSCSYLQLLCSCLSCFSSVFFLDFELIQASKLGRCPPLWNMWLTTEPPLLNYASPPCTLYTPTKRISHLGSFSNVLWFDKLFDAQEWLRLTHRAAQENGKGSGGYFWSSFVGIPGSGRSAVWWALDRPGVSFLTKIKYLYYYLYL